MLAKGLSSPTSSTVSKPRLSAVLLGEGESCQRQPILPPDVEEKRGREDEEKSLFRSCSQEQVVLN